MFLRTVVTITTLFTMCLLSVADASARGRNRCKKSNSCSTAWGGSYGSCGSSGGSYVQTCQPVVQTVCVSQGSFGSCGASGGSYVNCGSVGGSYAPTVYYQPMTGASSAVSYSTVVSSSVNQNQQALSTEINHGVTSFKSTAAVPMTEHATTTPSAQTVTSKTENESAQLGQSVLENTDTSGLCAYLVLRDVPADADVYLVDKKMTARGAVRKYRIPVRLESTEYSYAVEIRLPGNDQVAASAKTTVRASETTELWVARFNDDLVLSETKANKIETSAPLASR